MRRRRWRRRRRERRLRPRPWVLHNKPCAAMREICAWPGGYVCEGAGAARLRRAGIPVRAVGGCAPQWTPAWRQTRGSLIAARHEALAQLQQREPRRERPGLRRRLYRPRVEPNPFTPTPTEAYGDLVDACLNRSVCMQCCAWPYSIACGEALAKARATGLKFVLTPVARSTAGEKLRPEETGGTWPPEGCVEEGETKRRTTLWWIELLMLRIRQTLTLPIEVGRDIANIIVPPPPTSREQRERDEAILRLRGDLGAGSPCWSLFWPGGIMWVRPGEHCPPGTTSNEADAFHAG